MKTFAGVVVTTFLIVVLLLLNHLPLGSPVEVYSVVFVVSSLVYLVFARQVLTHDIPPRVITILVACSVVLRLSFLTTSPIGSDDAYRYIWDAKVEAHGINPYAYSPEAPELGTLRSGLLPARVNHPAMKTVYFPVAEWIFLGGYALSGEAIWGYKAELFLAEILTIAGLFLLTQTAGKPRKYVLLYVLCPLSVVSFAIDSHVDGFGLPFLVFALVLYLRGSKMFAWILLGISISIKPVGAILLPLLFFKEQGFGRRAATFIIPAVIVAVQFLPYLGRISPFESLTIYTERWMFNGGVFNVLLLVFRDNGLARIVCGVLLACSIALTVMSREDVPTKAVLAIFLLLIFSPVVHPWYVSWLAVLLPVVPRWSALMFSAAVSLASVTAISFASSGLWKDYPLVLVLEYLPVAVLFLRELPKRRSAAPHYQ